MYRLNPGKGNAFARKKTLETLRTGKNIVRGSKSSAVGDGIDYGKSNQVFAKLADEQRSSGSSQPTAKRQKRDGGEDSAVKTSRAVKL